MIWNFLAINFRQIHSKKGWVVHPNFGSDMDKPNHWVTFYIDIFNPMFGFVHILPKIGVKQPSIFRVYKIKSV